jgi:hypothetical protein
MCIVEPNLAMGTNGLTIFGRSRPKGGYCVCPTAKKTGFFLKCPSTIGFIVLFGGEKSARP